MTHSSDSGAGDVPPHLAHLEFNSLAELESVLAEATGNKRALAWLQADLCAAAYRQFPDTLDLDGTLASLMSCSEMTVSRRRRLGETFPPEIMRDGASFKLRSTDRPLDIYLAALDAADPIACILWALDEEMTAKQIREELRGETPTAWVSIGSEEFYATTDENDIHAWLDEQFYMIDAGENTNGRGYTKHIKIAVSATYELET